MATYQIRGLPDGAIGEFKRRCRQARVSPDDLLRALIVNTTPEYREVEAVTTVTHRLTIHHSPVMAHDAQPA